MRPGQSSALGREICTSRDPFARTDLHGSFPGFGRKGPSGLPCFRAVPARVKPSGPRRPLPALRSKRLEEPPRNQEESAKVGPSRPFTPRGSFSRPGRKGSSRRRPWGLVRKRLSPKAGCSAWGRLSKGVSTRARLGGRQIRESVSAATGSTAASHGANGAQRGSAGSFFPLGHPSPK